MTQHTPSGLPAAFRTERRPTAIDAAAEAYYEKLLELDPGRATIEGRPGRETEYADYSPAGHLAFVEAAREALAAINALEVVDAVDAVTVDVMNERLGLIIELHEADLGDWEINNIATPAHGIRQTFDLMPQETPEDWAHVIGRMAHVPDALAGYRETLADFAARGRVAAARQVRILAQQSADYGREGGFFDGLARGAALSDPSSAEAAREAATAARAAYTELSDYLSGQLLPLAPAQDAMGVERYRLHSREYLGAAVDLEETYRWGVEELERIIAEQEAVAQRIRPGATIAEAKEILDTDPRRILHGTEALREWMQGLSDAAVAGLAEEHFTIEGPMKELECRIAPTQDGGIYYTGPSADFRRPGRMWWSIPPGETEFTTWGETSTVYHEGVPGHHLQIATATAMAGSLNSYRSQGVWVSGHGEGWALYAERLMDELGYLSDAGDAMGMLNGQRMRAARVVFDIGVHCGYRIPERWAREIGASGTWDADSGRAFLELNLDDSPGQLEFEFNRYLGWAGQAPSYKIGQRIWEELRNEALARGESLRDFHTRALMLGSVGLDTLRRALTPSEA